MNIYIQPIVEEFTEKYTVDELVYMLLKVGIPAAPISNIEKVANDPHIAGVREMFVEINHLVCGKVKVTGNQLKFSDTKVKIDRSSPMLGEHNESYIKRIFKFLE